MVAAPWSGYHCQGALGDVVAEGSTATLDGEVDGIFIKETRPNHGMYVAAERRLSDEAVG
jgi:hypothetical protein